MNTILISYDLNSPESRTDYDLLIDRIKEFPKWAHPLESFCLVKTNKSTSEVRDDLKPYIDENDELFVINVTGRGWASRGLTTKITNWLKTNM